MTVIEKGSLRRPLFANVLYPRFRKAAQEHGEDRYREQLLEGLTGRVLELGCGDGAHFRLYPETVTELVGLEPEENLRERAEKACASARCPVRIVPGFAEDLPAAEGEFDAAVAALVLCSVRDQQLALAELMRVIRPGGELRFFEHVRADARLHVAPSSPCSRFGRSSAAVATWRATPSKPSAPPVLRSSAASTLSLRPASSRSWPAHTSSASRADRASWGHDAERVLPAPTGAQGRLMEAASTAAAVTVARSEDWLRAARLTRLLSWLSLVWLGIEGTVAIVAGVMAGSVALIAFGLDSAIEGVASVVVIWRFSGSRLLSATAERRAQLLVAAQFFLLAPFISFEALETLVTGAEIETSWLGIALTSATLVVCQPLGLAKRRLGARLGSPATVGEGTQNLLCGYLAVAVLTGLLANTLLGLWWLDPVVALGIAAVAVREGRRALRGEACGCATC